MEPAGLNEDVVTEILLRLPSVDVVRCRAVCRAWRRITTGPVFLAHHARRSPVELVLISDGRPCAVSPDDDDTPRRLHVRFPDDYYARYSRNSSDVDDEGGLLLLGSCDGLLLFQMNKDGGLGLAYFVCNPSTRQQVSLPRSDTMARPCGLYLHAQSGEHRFLFFANDDDRRYPTSASYYVLSLGGAAQRRRLPRPAPDAGVNTFTSIPEQYLRYRDNLHWLYHPHVQGTGKILAFDTVRETFRRISMPPPSLNRGRVGPSLLETDGMLSVLDGRTTMDLWVLEDYGDDRTWTRRLRIDQLHPPQPSYLGWTAVHAQDNVAILVRESSSDAHAHAVLYDLTGNRVLKHINFSNRRGGARLTDFVFKESLVPLLI